MNTSNSSSQVSQFITESILTKGYNMQQVLEFLSKKKENGKILNIVSFLGEDLELWNMDELLAVSEEFESNFTPQQQQVQPSLANFYHNNQINEKEEEKQSYSFKNQQAQETSNNQLKQTTQSNNFAKQPEGTPTDLSAQHQFFQQSQQVQQSLQSFYQYPPLQNQGQLQQNGLLQSQQPNGNQDKQVLANQIQERKKSHITQLSQFLNNQKLSEVNVFDPKRYYQIVNVKKMEIKSKGILNKPGVSVIISGFEQKSGGLFKKNYIVYKVEIKQYGIMVLRRYSDFEHLREYLTKNYPEFLIPPIPKKTTHTKFFTLFEQRMKLLEIFLNRLLQNEEFKYDQFVEQFLSTSEENQFKNQQKDAMKFTRLFDSKFIENSTGQITIQISPVIDQFFTQKVSQLEQTEQIQKKIRKLTKKLAQSISIIDQDMKEIGNCYASLFNLQQQFNQQIPMGGINNSLQGIYTVLNNLYMEWSQQFEHQNLLLKQHLIYFQKFQKQEINSIKELIKSRDYQQCEGQKFLQKLDCKKDKYFKEQNINKWEIPKEIIAQVGKDKILNDQKLAFELMFPKENQVWQFIKDNFGYINNQIYEQLKINQNYVVKDIAATYIQFSLNQQSLIEKLNLWPSMASAFSCCGQGRKIITCEEVQMQKSVIDLDDD